VYRPARLNQTNSENKRYDGYFTLLPIKRISNRMIIGSRVNSAIPPRHTICKADLSGVPCNCQTESSQILPQKTISSTETFFAGKRRILFDPTPK
jgi:hypothetical protein